MSKFLINMVRLQKYRSFNSRIQNALNKIKTMYWYSFGQSATHMIDLYFDIIHFIVLFLDTQVILCRQATILLCSRSTILCILTNKCSISCVIMHLSESMHLIESMLNLTDPCTDTPVCLQNLQ